MLHNLLALRSSRSAVSVARTVSPVGGSSLCVAMNADDYETLPTQRLSAHMAAGAIAGVMEHCVMYPLDSVKTRMQSLGVATNATVLGTLRHMVQHEGVWRPVRGMSAVVAGAGPAHALYFSTYEFSKDFLGKLSNQRHTHLVHGASGCLASLVHDGISNPTEVVKQRLQMYNSPYRSVVHCIAQVYRTEGMRAFYRSYVTQLTMNVPFQSLYFMTYEIMQNVTNKEKTYNPAAHMVSGAIAGAIAAAATTPLDVCKTVLNTQEPGIKAKGFMDAVSYVMRLGGPFGFFRGIQARVLYQMPAAAICWSTYETFKYLFKSRIEASEEKAKIEATAMLTSPKEKGINLRLVLPQASVKADSNGSEMPGPSLPSSEGLKGIKTMELPAVNGANLYGNLSLSTIHHGDCQVPTLRHT